MEAEFLKDLKDFSPLTLAIIAFVYAVIKLAPIALEKMKLDSAEKDKLLVYLTEQVKKLNEDLHKMQEELSTYRNKFFDLETQHARLRKAYDELNGVMNEQKKAKH